VVQTAATSLRYVGRASGYEAIDRLNAVRCSQAADGVCGTCVKGALRDGDGEAGRQAGR
jgi:hypothetical protein